MATVNKVILIGRLTADPEPLHTFANGTTYASFRFVVSRNRKNPQTGQWENDPNPMYIDCTAYSSERGDRLVTVITNYLRKGSQVYVEGRLDLQNWEDKQTGGKRSKHRIVLTDIQILDAKNEDRAETPRQERHSPQQRTPAPTEEADIPF